MKIKYFYKFLTEEFSNLKIRFSLNKFITLIVTLSVLSGSTLFGYYALRTFQHHKTIDTKEILFLEIEKMTNKWKNVIEKSMKNPHYRYSSTEKVFNRLHGSGPLTIPFAEFGPNPTTNIFSFVQGSGINYILNTALDKVNATEIDVNKIFQSPAGFNGVIYILNRKGQFFYSNDPNLDRKNISHRTLVQYFIPSDLGRGVIDFWEDEMKTGFFGTIHQTNLIVFAEIKNSSILKPVDNLITQGFFVLILCLLCSVLLLQLPLMSIKKSLRNLFQASITIADGNFKSTIPENGFGEIKILSHTFNVMQNKLHEREISILKLMESQNEKVRIEGELAITKSVQENFLPKKSQFFTPHISGASIFKAANEVSGDWYNFASHPENGSTVVVIADVSGHGAGSAMFTAVIAGIFDDIKSKWVDKFPSYDFLNSVNGVIYRLGQGKWHATVCMITLEKNSAEIEIISAGHCFPLLIEQKNKKNKVSSIRMGGMPLGLEKETSFTVKKIPWKPETSLVLFTDGIIESQSINGTLYGKRRLRQTLSKISIDDPRHIVSEALEDCLNFSQGVNLSDDICVVAMNYEENECFINFT